MSGRCVTMFVLVGNEERTLLGDPLIVDNRPRQPVDVHYCKATAGTGSSPTSSSASTSADNVSSSGCITSGARVYMTTYDTTSDLDFNEQAGMVVEYIL